MSWRIQEVMHLDTGCLHSDTKAARLMEMYNLSHNPDKPKGLVECP